MEEEQHQADRIIRRHHRPSVPVMTMELPIHPQRIILFGDQTESVLPAIQTLYKRAPSSIYIQHFLRVSIDAARQSLEQLCSGSEKNKFYFDSFLTLAEGSTQRQCPDVVVQTLLLCVAQLGHLVLYVHLSFGQHDSPTNRMETGNSKTSQNASKTPFRWDGVPVSYPLPWQLVHIPWFKSFSFLLKRSTSQSD